MNGFKYIRNEQYKRTLDELANELGVSKQIVYMWESGKKKIPQKRLEQLKEITGIPEKYFILEDVSERERMEINNYRLNKELDDHAFDYEDTFIDSSGNEQTVQAVHLDPGLMEHIEFNEKDIKILDLSNKIQRTIREYHVPYGDDEYASTNDMLSSIDTNINTFDRLTDIVQQSNRQGDEPYRIFLYQMIRAMELYYGIGEKHRIWGKEPASFHPELVSDERPMVQELLSIMVKYRKEKDTQMEKDYKEYKELFGEDEK